jgi:hypothetical protein
MLKRHVYVFTSPAICYFLYADDTDGNACVVYVRCSFFQLGGFRICKNMWKLCIPVRITPFQSCDFLGRNLRYSRDRCRTFSSTFGDLSHAHE